MVPEFEASQGVILIVDDVPENLSLLSASLDQAGYVVLVARDGASALRTLDQTVPDIILMDAVMPGLDGFRTCELIKQREVLRDVPVIFMTALTESSHVLRGFSVGAVDYVTKPIRTDEVLARLSAHLRTSRHMNQVHEALEASAQAVLVINATGMVAWRSSRADALLERHAASGNSLPSGPAWLAWLHGHIAARSGGTPAAEFVHGDIVLRAMGRYAGSEMMLAIETRTREGDAAALAEQFNLTAREAEVLFWAARGKTSRDIAQILAMSPRTVDKHFEHIFAKLGAESRTSAISIALNYLREESRSGSTVRIDAGATKRAG